MGCRGSEVQILSCRPKNSQENQPIMGWFFYVFNLSLRLILRAARSKKAPKVIGWRAEEVLVMAEAGLIYDEFRVV
ncbi:hypothetical protein AL518_20705 [Hafnia paralvei]|nr:hypothetical protein AL518_20705 [Hafnia paralvei]